MFLLFLQINNKQGEKSYHHGSIRSIRKNSIDIQQNATDKGKAKSTLISNKKSRTQELDTICIVPTASKNILASPSGIITSEDSYAIETDTTFDLSSPVSVSKREGFCFEIADLRTEQNALKKEVEMLNMKMPFM